MSKYESVVQRVFDTVSTEHGTEGDIPFHRDDLEEAIDDLGLTIGNVPDIPYAYRGRRSLPDSITRHGYEAIILDDTQPGEEPTYRFTTREQQIEIPDAEQIDARRTISGSDLPDPVQEHLGTGEQAILTQLRYLGLIGEFTGCDCYHLQSHLRMRVNGREAELDDLYIGVTDDAPVAIAVEAKGDGESLNRNQLLRNTVGVQQQDRYPDTVRTLAVTVKDDAFYLFEFSIDSEESELTPERVWECLCQQED